MYLSTDGRSQATNPSSKQCQESSNQRPSPSASPSAPVPAVSWSAQRQPHVFLHTLHCSRPRRPQTVVECPWSCSRYALQDILQASSLLACIALQLDQDSSPVVGPPFGGFSRGRLSFHVAPRVLSYGPERHAWQKDRSVRSQLRSSVACLSELFKPRLLASLCHSGTVPSKCPMYFIYSCARHICDCYSKPRPAFTRSRRPF